MNRFRYLNSWLWFGFMLRNIPNWAIFSFYAISIIHIIQKRIQSTFIFFTFVVYNVLTLTKLHTFQWNNQMNLMVHKIFSKSTRQVALMVKLRKTDQNYSTTKSNTKLAFPSLICGFLEVISSCVNLVYCSEWICSNSHLGKILQKNLGT